MTAIACWSTGSDYGTLPLLPYACVDIGSNTTRLLVAEVEEGGFREIASVREFTLLGSAAAEDGSIPRAKIVETAEAAAAQVDGARRLGVRLIAVVGTAVLRSAPNARELAQEVERMTGFPLQVLPEAAEAELSFLGATSAAGMRAGDDGPVAVADVGGGSSELSVGRPGERPSWWRSVPVGSAALARMCISSDPPTVEELKRCRVRTAQVVRSLEPPRAAVALAVGGSANSLRLLCGERLDEAALDEALSKLADTPASEVAREHGIDVRRVKLLPAGIAILAEIAALLGTPLRVARGGLREGVILRLAGAAQI